MRLKVVNLDFEARVPVPFSIFPRTYQDSDDEPESSQQHTTQTHEEVEITLPQKPQAGREGQYSSHSTHADLPPRGEHRYSEEEVRITREEERYRRPGIREEYHSYERRPHSTHETIVDYDRRPQAYSSPIDVAEREYRARVQPSFQETQKESYSYAVEAPRRHTSSYSSKQAHVGSTVEVPVRPAKSYYSSSHVAGTTVDVPKPVRSYSRHTTVVDETVEPRKLPSHKPSRGTSAEETVETRKYIPKQTKSKMGYYDDDASAASARPVSYVEEPVKYMPNTVSIPCNHIRLGDILMLQGRPCQVIRISTSAATGQHRYLGVDLFTKQLHEESSSITNPAPSVVVQTMLGPVLKQYRVLDMQDGTVVAMTETGDVKQALPVLEQSGLWSRLRSAFDSGRGSVRVLVINDQGRELAVDMKVVHGSRL